MDTRKFNTQPSASPRNRMCEPQSVLSCPLCGVENVTTNWHLHSYDYGSGKSSVKIRVRVPVRRCDTCEIEYLDDEGERLEHIALCDHFGVLSPEQIRDIRNLHGMRRAAFARVTGLGEASLNRWENALSIQTHANDRYLRLLAHPDTMRRLQGIVAAQQSTNLSADGVDNPFRVLELTDSLFTEQAGFCLHRAA